MPAPELERELTIQERFTWGQCPVCEAPHGEPCYACVGVQIGHRADGRLLRDGEGVHLARLERAPFKIRIVPAN